MELFTLPSLMFDRLLVAVGSDIWREQYMTINTCVLPAAVMLTGMIDAVTLPTVCTRVLVMSSFSVVCLFAVFSRQSRPSVSLQLRVSTLPTLLVS